MPRAVCIRCGEIVWWQATRGSKLSRLRCPKCRGSLRSAPHGSLPEDRVWYPSRFTQEARK